MVEAVTSAAAVLSPQTTAAWPRARSRFFLAMSIVMLATVFLGFGPTLFLRASFDVPDLPLYLFVHGAVLTGWYALFVIQSACIAAKRPDLHRRLGILGAVLGAAAVAVSALTALRLGPRLAARGVDVEARLHFLSEIVWLNIALLICFSVFLFAAVVLRHRPQIHKRLMVLASISFLPPAITRIIDWPIWGMGNNAYFPLLCCVVVLLVALGLHDVASRRSVHPVTLAGGAVVVSLFAVGTFVMPNTEVGRSVVYGLYNLMR